MRHKYPDVDPEQIMWAMFFDLFFTKKMDECELAYRGKEVTPETIEEINYSAATMATNVINLCKKNIFEQKSKCRESIRMSAEDIAKKHNKSIGKL